RPHRCLFLQFAVDQLEPTFPNGAEHFLGGEVAREPRSDGHRRFSSIRSNVGAPQSYADRQSRPSRSAHSSASTGLTSRPMPSISAVTTWPGLRNRPRPLPVPPGVPVAMISPGFSVIIELMNAMIEATGKIICLVLASCI